jgi:hypothetical protein
MQSAGEQTPFCCIMTAFCAITACHAWLSAQFIISQSFLQFFFPAKRDRFFMLKRRTQEPWENEGKVLSENNRFSFLVGCCGFQYCELDGELMHVSCSRFSLERLSRHLHAQSEKLLPFNTLNLCTRKCFCAKLIQHHEEGIYFQRARLSFAPGQESTSLRDLNCVHCSVQFRDMPPSLNNALLICTSSKTENNVP